ncbi:hypothetical protein MGG_16944 [Pyricularia oryzae 70-15]|uniref:Uncharacterized protein n=1 Tax=Pyricularia oryzae (strain 70-15 / ATCC MYA-4617 / FGSC 8958) TaxID=242507 RepID=G5EGV9_PYRO7|nr:uncharacterized protein MGG_16934 [Pyricularia oryzae 70-15]XP_003713054.1 uncharacterized protein MGG_16944 [Pyricularia oryzae 70-15]EHA53221.1 hypothetical protein MGG_16934 [Pyricularia oryzae 70-15]EHA53247.1 hypothetical protein MGG_16944 [Pyricularia oryzae 70-15]
MQNTHIERAYRSRNAPCRQYSGWERCSANGKRAMIWTRLKRRMLGEFVLHWISDTTTSSKLRKWRNWAKPWRLARVAARPTQGDSSCSSSEQLSHTHIQHLIPPMHLLRREQRENPGRLLSH